MGLDARFARPVHWIVALFEEQVIPFSFGKHSKAETAPG